MSYASDIIGRLLSFDYVSSVGSFAMKAIFRRDKLFCCYAFCEASALNSITDSTAAAFTLVVEPLPNEAGMRHASTIQIYAPAGLKELEGDDLIRYSAEEVSQMNNQSLRKLVPSFNDFTSDQLCQRFIIIIALEVVPQINEC
jgi:hypothetical protein